MWRGFFAVIFAVTVAGWAAASEPAAARIILLANSDDPDSLRLAHYYAEKRGVPEANIIALKLSLAESVGWHEFVRTLFQPLQDELVKRDWIDGIAMNATDGLGRRQYAMSGHRISYLVVCRGVPLKVTGDAEMPADPAGLAVAPPFRTHTGAVDSELALLAQSGTPTLAFVPNPLFRKDRPSVLDLGQVVKVSRLDGPTPEDARRLIDQAIATEQIGLIGRSYVDIGGPHAAGDRWLEETVKALAELGFDGDVDRAPGTLPAWARFDAPVLYFGWYAGEANGPFIQPGFVFPPGAIALHIHSYSADTVQSPLRNWVGPLVARGVTATFGNVTEPYLEFTHEPQLILQALARGDTLGDAAAYAVPVYSWQGLVIGDPLYRPFKVSFEQQWRERDRLSPALRPYVVLRRMRQQERAGQINQAIWTGLEAQKTGSTLAVALAIANLQRAAGDVAGARLTLAPLAERRSFTLAEEPLATMIAQRLLEAGEAKLALALWRTVLGTRKLSSDMRIEWLRAALETARAAQDSGQTVRWQEELNALTAPVTMAGK
ncbi:MAG: TIGR03790 family protein [Verrucomicrobia bacterium]|nr:TIGR03790 family protein [Verrucomicrobiota bacterium]